MPKTLEPYPEVSVFSLLADSAASFPDSVALAFLGKHVSYRELFAEVERFSAVLAGLGVKKGDRVGLMMPNCPQFVIACTPSFGSARSSSGTTRSTRNAS